MSTADAYTSLLPETDLAIAEAAARLVPRARRMEQAPRPGRTSKRTRNPDRKPCRTVPGNPQPSRAMAAHPLTQTAPDAESEAE